MSQPTKLVFRSLRLYLADYKDTSKSKEFRINSLISANTIAEYILYDIVKDNEILLAPFRGIELGIKNAILYPNMLHSFTNSIGFLQILED